MAKDILIFRRVEKKYPVTELQREHLLERIGDHLTEDAHGHSTVMSIYLDTPDKLLIRNSIDAVCYKEKLRLRSYGTPGPDDRVFLELKKKYHGVVYKRRVSLPLRQAEAYIRGGEMPIQSQIMREIDYAMEFYRHPKPSMLVAYERNAYYVRQMPNVRLTFDSAVRYREYDLSLSQGNEGRTITQPGHYLLELKTDGAMPVWLSRALDECGIYPSRYSKYANAYLDSMKRNQTEGNHHVRHF